MAVDISQETQAIRTAVFAKDVRDNIAGGLDTMASEMNTYENNLSSDNDQFKADIGNRQTNLENTFNQEIANQSVANPSNAETVAARTDNVANTTYSTLGARLDAHSSELAGKATKDDLKIPPSPYMSFFGWTGTIDVEKGGTFDSNIAGDPCIVWDNDNNCYRMFYFGFDGTHTYCLSAIATSLNISGTNTHWSKINTNLSAEGYTNRHKMTILVDGLGNPVKINNKYHAYVVGYPTKDIFHWESDRLDGLWHETGSVIERSFAGNGTDNFGVDAPSAIWDGNNVVLFYMAQPNTSLSDFGLAHRTNRAISNTPESGFTYDGCACTPSPNSGDWFYGWIGGAQPRLAPDGSWWIAINASNTRPSGAGVEDARSLWGMAKAKTLRSTWTVDLTPRSYLPMVGEDTASIGINKPVEAVNVWRPFLIYDTIIGKWAAYYNTGLAGNEKITHQIENFLYYRYNSDNIVQLSTTETYIPCSRICLAKGSYKIRFECNIMGCATTLTHLDVGILAYLGSYRANSKIFYTGNYNYDNVNAILETPVLISEDNVTIEFRTQVMSSSAGTPDGSNSRLRYYFITVEKI